ncbi:MAG TPA: ATP-binding cassette domain-containing protein [Chloroflexota bacterium]|nr:ATP-binding cassette domain-containing protein [Chloroflexota bacterium]
MSPTIVVEHLSKHYRVHKKSPGLAASLRSLVHREYLELDAVSDVSFALEQGELVGFLGPNGAGKTTTLKMLSGLLHPSAGTATVLGYEPWKRDPRFQRRFSLVMGQKNQLWWDLPAIESFLLNKEIYGVSDDSFRKTLDELVDLLGLEPLLQVQVRRLSLGERMKCELAAALIHQPEVLFLDEPTIGLDVLMQHALRDFIRVYNQRRCSTIVLTSHYMEDMKELCDRVIIISKGRLIYDGRLDSIVERYTDERDVTATFHHRVEASALAPLGELIDYRGERATLRVPRAQLAERTSVLLARFPVDDLAVAEPDIEEVIRKVFSE